MGCLCDESQTNNSNQKSPKNKKDKSRNKSNKNNENIIKSEIIKINSSRDNKIDAKKYSMYEYSKQTENEKKFIKEALNKINYWRIFHGVEPLEEDDDLNKRAFIIAKQFLTDGTFDIVNLNYENGGELGMNALKCENELKPEKLIEKWHSEKDNYNFQEPQEFELESNNFTQMIWKDSKKFGLGFHYQKEEIPENENTNDHPPKKGKIINAYYYIALFYPAGNIPEKYKDNVISPEIDEEKMKFIDAVLIKNNEYRKLHQAEPLEKSEYLCKRAFILAKQYSKNKISDDLNLKYRETEEKSGLNIMEENREYKPEELMKKWYSESEYYNFDNPKKIDRKKCLNFTQMIWKDSKYFGIGYYHKKDEDKKVLKTFYLALYYPAGNLDKDYKTNVLEKKEEIRDGNDIQNQSGTRQADERKDNQGEQGEGQNGKMENTERQRINGKKEEEENGKGGDEEGQSREAQRGEGQMDKQ